MKANRFLMFALMAGLLWFSMGNSPVLADGMVLPAALSPDYLVIRYHRVKVAIEDNHAVTRVEQAFYNPNPFSITGRYLFPVPPEAILSRFQATVDGKVQSVERQDAATTNATLYEHVVQRHDPSLLQYVDWESVAFDLTLPPGGSRQMTLEYEQVLAPSGGLYHYRYVLGVERYTSQPLEEVSVTVDLHSSSGLSSLYSSSHAVTTEWMGAGRARVTWAAEEVTPSEDFDLYFAPADGGFGGGLLTGRRNGEDHFLFLFSPAAESSRADAIPKDIVFVIDRSGSMGGEKIDQAGSALQFILGQLGEEDRFSIVSFDNRVSTWADVLRPVNRRTLAEARRYVDRLSADGNTDLEAALQAGLEILERSESRGLPRVVVFLTDGLPTAGITDPTLIARRVTEANARLEARLHVFGVGYDVNTHLLDGLAADNGGRVTYVQPGENLEAILTGFYSSIAHPVLTDVGIDFEGMEISDLHPQTMPDLFQGSSLLLAGRYRVASGPVRVRVTGWAGGEKREYTYHFDLDRVAERDFVPRLWATRRLGELLDRVRVGGESPALVSEIRELGLSYGLVTPYTTFVIAGQAEGPASEANNRLYRRGDLNQAWGQTTIQARVQNQAYQQAIQPDLARGANVVHSGSRSLAQVGNQNVDLSLLKGLADLDGPMGEDWVAQNVSVDRTVAFGSKAYFILAADPEARVFLQSGRNVTFVYQGQIISVQDSEVESVASDVVVHGSEGKGAQLEFNSLTPVPTPRPGPSRGQKGTSTLCVGPQVMALLFGLAVVVVRRYARPR